MIYENLYLGQINHEQVADFYAALDVGVICVRETPFGRYSFPQKAYEMAAMKIPLVVAAVGAMAQLFSSYPESLYQPDEVSDLAQKLEVQLLNPTVPHVPIPTWAEQAAKVERVLMALC